MNKSHHKYSIPFFKFVVLVYVLLLNSSYTLSYCQDKLTFQSIQTGLSNKYIRCILKDSYGVMWFGTYNGLNRYDGTNMIVYEHDPKNINSLCHNLINAIVEDANKNIWIATAEGLNLYNRELDNFINIDSVAGNKNHLTNTFITSIFCANDGCIWLGTMGNGINIYNPKKLQYEYITFVIPNSGSRGQDYITSLISIDNKFWVGTREGIYYMNIINGNIMPEVKSMNDNIVGKGHILSLSLDNNGHLLASIQNRGLYCIENKNSFFEVFPYPLSNKVPGINKVLTTFCDKNNKLWIGTENYGLTIIDENSISHYVFEEGNPQSITSNSIWSLYVDNTDKAWIGTFNKGICLIDKNYDKFENYQRNIFAENTLSDNDVTAFAADNADNLWIATDGGGLSVFNLNNRQFKKTINTQSKPLGISNNAIKTLCLDTENSLWIGTWADGIDRIDLNSNRLKNYKLISKGTGDNMLQCINEDKLHNIWAGTSGSGIFIYDKAYDQFIKPVFAAGSPSIPENAYISSVFESADNIIWVGTYYGLFALQRLNKSEYTCTPYYRGNDNTSISSNRISIIFEDSKKNLWFGTIDNGLNLLEQNSKNFRYIEKKDGLSGNMVNGILEDKKGNLWISSNNGITRFNQQTGSTNNYFKEDGLVSDAFYPGACYQTNTGEFLFGSDNGFNLFNPDNITVNPDRPVMYLTGLKINNKLVHAETEGSPLTKDISMTQQIILTYKQTSFTINYVGISYTRPSCNTYQYMLEGFDNEWNQAGAQTSATYTNLNPGTYHFIVKGFNNDGIECLNPAEIFIKVRPSVWKTWWAYCFYILSILLLLILLIRIRIERIKMANSLQMERLAREKEHELNQSKTQFFTNISHEFRTPLSLIIGPLESLISSSNTSNKFKSKLQNIYKNANRLMQLVNELMDFRKIEERKLSLKVRQTEILKFVSEIASPFKDEAKRRGIRFENHSSEKVINGWIDDNKIGKVISNILSNAFKYTSDKGEIIIATERYEKSAYNINKDGNAGQPTYLKISVTDNGKGIPVEDLPYVFDQFFQAKNSLEGGTGIGLTIARNLIELHHGSIEVQSIPDKQTVFSFALPIDQEAYRDDEKIEYNTDIIHEKSKIYSATNELQDTVIAGLTEDEKLELLIVEDNDELREFLTSELNTYYKIVIGKDGQEGLEKAFNNIPDLILTDVMMPKMNGIDLCKKIKDDVRTSHIPVIMLTAKTSIDDQVEGLEGGVDVYITKPFSIKFLQSQIKQLISSRQNLYSIFSREIHIIPGQFAKNKLDEKFLETIINFITSNITDNQLGVEMIAKHVNLSRGQVYKKIKAITGQSAVEFVRNIRLKQAVKLMETRKYSLSEIAYQTGFASPSYFTRSFKDHYGKAPSDFLKED
jgi:signal transduction histidine kinase/ligand-binding sensor domain-containing protein/DNA-binding response OmpR family regulator